MLCCCCCCWRRRLGKKEEAWNQGEPLAMAGSAVWLGSWFLKPRKPGKRFTCEFGSLEDRAPPVDDWLRLAGWLAGVTVSWASHCVPCVFVCLCGRGGERRSTAVLCRDSGRGSSKRIVLLQEGEERRCVAVRCVELGWALAKLAVAPSSRAKWLGESAF